jgi:pimeloyl-ACP methyl ester carboxylesterase
MADFFISSSPSLTIYLLDARGTGLSSPLDCISPPVGAFNPYNSSQLDSYHNCNIDIMARYSTKLQYYTTYDSASDLRDVINLINPTTVSLLGVSYGTYSTNTYMLLPGARYDCVILDGPVPPNSWSIENNAVWNTHVTQDLLSLCVSNSSLCANYLGIVGHIPRLVLDQIVDQTLPCLSKIPWLNTPSGQHWIAIYSNSMTASRTAQSLLGPFYYRLYRCSDSDVAQLINFDQVKQVNGSQL